MQTVGPIDNHEFVGFLCYGLAGKYDDIRDNYWNCYGPKAGKYIPCIAILSILDKRVKTCYHNEMLICTHYHSTVRIPDGDAHRAQDCT